MAARSIAVLAMAAAALSAAAALAVEPPAPAEKQRRICRGGERQLGSHVRTERRCRTAEQWRLEDERGTNRPLSLQVTPGQNDGQRPRTPQ
ncbi:MAG TPA: hypothetical protein VEX35_05780 [Allosphingosinicella sp.]|nr:hypothetical protein [Allosphingosinicella sp.]